MLQERAHSWAIVRKIPCTLYVVLIFASCLRYRESHSTFSLAACTYRIGSNSRLMRLTPRVCVLGDECQCRLCIVGYNDYMCSDVICRVPPTSLLIHAYIDMQLCTCPHPPPPPHTHRWSDCISKILSG